MGQARFHGRRGQGAPTAAELLASAAFGEDRHARAFPGFGPERIGAPVLAAINDKFTGTVAEGNAAAQTAFDFVRDEREALTEAAIS